LLGTSPAHRKQFGVPEWGKADRRGWRVACATGQTEAVMATWGYGLGSCWHFTMPWDDENIEAMLCMGMYPGVGHAHAMLLTPGYLGIKDLPWSQGAGNSAWPAECAPRTGFHQPLPTATRYSSAQLSEEWFDEKCHCSGICNCEWLLPGEAAILLIPHQNGFLSQIRSKPEK